MSKQEKEYYIKCGLVANCEDIGQEHSWDHDESFHYCKDCEETYIDEEYGVMEYEEWDEVYN